MSAFAAALTSAAQEACGHAQAHDREQVDRDDDPVEAAHGIIHGRGDTSSGDKSIAEPSSCNFTTVSIASRAAAGTVMTSFSSRFTTVTLPPLSSEADLILR